MTTPINLIQFQEILRLLEMDMAPEGQVLQGVLTDLLESDPCEFHTKVPQGYTAQQCYLLLMHSAMLNTSLNSAALDLMGLGIKTPTGEAVLNQLKKRDYERLMTNMDQLFHRQWERLNGNVRKFIASQLIVSLDMVQHPYYGDIKKAQVVGGKMKGGVRRHHTYGSAKILWEGHGLTVAVRMLHVGQKRYTWATDVLTQVKQYGQPFLLLADGGFWIKELLWDWAQEGYAFIVHASGGTVQTETVKHLLQEVKLTKQIETTIYKINLETPKRELSVRLIAWSEENGDDRCIAVPRYLEELPIEWLVSLYRSRFAIETGYRTWNQLRPRTTSRDRNIRYTLVTTAVALYNAYSLARTGRQLPEAPQSRYWKRLVSLVRQQVASKTNKSSSKRTSVRISSPLTPFSQQSEPRPSVYVVHAPRPDKRFSLGSWSVNCANRPHSLSTDPLRVRVLPKVVQTLNLPPPGSYKDICTSGPLSKKFMQPTFYITIKGLLTAWFKALITLSNWIKQITYHPILTNPKMITH